MARPVYHFLNKPGWADVLETAYVFAGIRVPSGVSWVGVGRDARLPLLFISLALLLRGLLRSGHERARTIRIFFSACLGPLVLAFLISIFFKPIYFAGRYTILAFPAYLYVVSRALSDPSRSLQRLCRFGVICWMILLSRPLHHYFTDYEKAPFKSMANYVHNNIGPGDSVDISALNSDERISLLYYLSPVIKIISGPLDHVNSKIFVIATTRALPTSEQSNCKILEKKSFTFGHVDLLSC